MGSAAHMPVPSPNSTLCRGAAVAVAMVPLLLLVCQAAKYWHREEEVANPDELALLTA